MGKISPGILIRAVSCFIVIGAISTGGCIMEPVSLADFVENDEVKEALDKGVSIWPDSDDIPNLKAGGGRITGLDPDKYYKVEEWDADGIYIGVPQFVSSSGKRAGTDLTGIGRVSSGELSGLTNTHIYRLKWAVPLTEPVSYYYLSAGSGSSKYQTPIDGEIIIDPLPPESGDTLIFNPGISPMGNFDIVSVSVSSENEPAKRKPSSSPLSTDAFPGNVTDFVFYDKVNRNLYFLRVVFGEIDDSDGVKINPNFTDPDKLPTLEYSVNNGSTYITNVPNSISAMGNATMYIRVSNSTDYSSIQWYCNATLLASGGGVTISNNQLIITAGSGPFTDIKTYHLTVVGTASDGTPYGTSVYIKVDN